VLGKLIAGKILQKVISEKIKKKIVTSLGDLLVKSSKNKLDDKIWAKVKKALD